MADRSAARIFSNILTRVAVEPQTPARDVLIQDIYKQSGEFDFHPKQEFAP